MVPKTKEAPPMLVNEARSYLFGGEEVVLVIRPHPIVLGRSGLAPLAAIALFSASPGQLTFVILLVVFVRFSWDVAMWWMDRYILTTQRILSLAGLITKKVVTLPLEKITDLAYERTLLGRFLGYGSLVFESAGQMDFGRIDFVPDSDEFYRAVMAHALGHPPRSEPEPEPDGPSHVPRHQRDDAEPMANPGLNPDRDPEATDQIRRVRDD